MTILYFAHARRASGVPQEELRLTTPLTSTEFWALLIQLHPDLAPLRAVSRLARGHDFLPVEAIIGPDDEIAVIPPVSGG